LHAAAVFCAVLRTAMKQPLRGNEVRLRRVKQPLRGNEVPTCGRH